MQQKTILIIEDDFLNRRVTKKALLENDYKVLEGKSAEEALLILKTQTPHLIIIDINLGENQQNGIELAQNIKALFNIPYIFLTAYDTAEIVKRAVAATPHAYITKPFKNVDLVTTIELAILQAANKEQRKLTVPVKDAGYTIALPVDEIYYIESDGNYLLYHTNKKVYKSRVTIKQIMEQLPAEIFVQTHRAYVVNRRKIEKYGSRSLVVNNTEVPISKNYIEDSSTFFNQF